ncbi:zinc transporter ZIP1 [Drosophila teissieri]|uniref:zinc transporter ZIP1 n=1 Tax=Drosophila teissieri TaxID=7243 RepID=UPI001CBA025C|nr:zinc transporter ZIP1 [Drosophila teissieri]
MVDQHIIVAKIVAIVVLLLVTLIFCFIPYLLDRFYKWTQRPENNAREFKVVLCLLSFGGGVLIATTFIHMLPEVIDVVNALQDCRKLDPTPFGLPEVLLCAGFYLMYCIEETMKFVIRRRQQKKLREVITIKETGEDEETPKEPNWLRGLGIIVALSLHELFGGMAIGLEMSLSTVWFMTGAISVHKLVLAFCIGMEIMMAHTRWLLAVVYLLVFSIVTPIGVGIGIAVSESAAANEPSTVSGILQGLACGTLIYVVFFEIVAKKNAGVRVLLSSMVGFVLMFGLQIAIGEAKGKSHFTCP